jgi:hypothetical protein
MFLGGTLSSKNSFKVSWVNNLLSNSTSFNVCIGKNGN